MRKYCHRSPPGDFLTFEKMIQALLIENATEDF
jgi:hypothetical protein